MAIILIVDDEAQIRDLLYRLFENEHLCHTAESAEEALERIKAERYDVILMDISMPGMSGLELLTYTRQLQPDTPVVIITGIDYQQHFGELLRMGAFDYLLKPFSLPAAEEMVARALHHYERRHGEAKEGTP
jgi:DNA-binding NtrC family response regulator